MCVMRLLGAAPCQCFTPGGQLTTSPARMTSTGPPHVCVRPSPAVTMSVWPAGWVCHAERAPGSKVTLPPEGQPSRAGKSGSTRTVPVKYSAGPAADGWEPARVMVCDWAKAEATARDDTSARILFMGQQLLGDAAILGDSIPLIKT